MPESPLPLLPFAGHSFQARFSRPVLTESLRSGKGKLSIAVLKKAERTNACHRSQGEPSAACSRSPHFDKNARSALRPLQSSPLRAWFTFASFAFRRAGLLSPKGRGKWALFRCPLLAFSGFKVTPSGWPIYPVPLGPFGSHPFGSSNRGCYSRPDREAC
jgi:hypothetical protein